MKTPSPLLGQSMTSDSSVNSATATYTITFMQGQFFEEALAAAVFEFPDDVSVSNPAICKLNTQIIPCDTSGKTVTAYFTPITVPSTAYIFSISDVTNPYSFKQTPSIKITT
jgi:hypothetical protein